MARLFALLLLPLLTGCVPVAMVAIVGFPLHYALDENADTFWKDEAWGSTGLCTVFSDGSTVNCEEDG